MSDEMVKRLMAAGLSKQQATSVTADTLVKLFMPEDGKALLAEAQRQVIEMRDIVDALKVEYRMLLQKIEEISNTILAITKAQQTLGEVTEEKARNLIALYGALLSMNERMGAAGPEAVTNASYVAYAYLGGQAKRDTRYNSDRTAE